MTAIEIEHLSKQYTLGTIGSGTLWRDMNVWWARMRGKPNPYQKIGQVNDRTQKAEGDYVWALRDINLKIEEGDVVGIIGSNGAGKSTLLKILSRVTTPTTGRITTYGRIASLLEVGTGFHQEMTGRENIYMNGAIMGMTRAEITRKLDEIVDFAGVAKYIDTPVKRYSSGMTVRLGFAVAAFLEPEILVVDEVLAVGDAEFQQKAIGKMKDVSQGQGRTVLFVSHNMAAIRSLCTRGTVLQYGTCVFDGSANDAVDFYLKEGYLSHGCFIVNNIEECHPAISVTKIELNGTELSEITIAHNQDFLDVKIEGRLFLEMKMDYILVFRNENGQALASFSNAVYMGNARKFSKGSFSFYDRIQLPRFLGSGDCIVELKLYEPRVQDLVKAPRCAKLHFEGSMNEYCRPLNISKEGFLGLEKY